jgi:hypothetical protein
MQQREQHAAAPSRWILYHGTSTYRLKAIQRDNRLRVSPTGDPKIALTTERSVAEYFACNAVIGDHRNHPEGESHPVLLVMDGELLLVLQYELDGVSDPVWGDGECDWENEIACWADIDPLDDFLIEVTPVPADRWGAYRTGSDRAAATDIFMPSGPRLAHYELILMDDMVNRLEEGEITPRRADAIAAAVNLLRLTLRSENGATHPYGWRR